MSGFDGNPLGELHAELMGLRMLLDGGRLGEAREQLAEVLDRWPVLVAEVYGTPTPDDCALPLPGPYGAVEARSGEVRVHVQVRIDRAPVGPVDASG